MKKERKRLILFSLSFYSLFGAWKIVSMTSNRDNSQRKRQRREGQTDRQAGRERERERGGRERGREKGGVGYFSSQNNNKSVQLNMPTAYHC